jgi:hypothetical protein
MGIKKSEIFHRISHSDSVPNYGSVAKRVRLLPNFRTWKYLKYRRNSPIPERERERERVGGNISSPKVEIIFFPHIKFAVWSWRGKLTWVSPHPPIHLAPCCGRTSNNANFTPLYKYVMRLKKWGYSNKFWKKNRRFPKPRTDYN